MKHLNILHCFVFTFILLSFYWRRFWPFPFIILFQSCGPIVHLAHILSSCVWRLSLILFINAEIFVIVNYVLTYYNNYVFFAFRAIPYFLQNYVAGSTRTCSSSLLCAKSLRSSAYLRLYTIIHIDMLSFTSYCASLIFCSEHIL